MKNVILRGLVAVIASLGLISALSASNYLKNFEKGSPDLMSSGSIAFGPEGVLFVADQKAAKIVALSTGDTKLSSTGNTYKISDIDTKVAASLGSTPDQILINDMAVNPLSRSAWLSVSRGRGANAQPVIMKVNSKGEISHLNLDSIEYSKVNLPNAPEDKVTGEGRRAKNKRLESITDMAYVNEQLVVAGLSNEEFASNLRSIPFPFRKVNEGASIEIYHGAHGKYETHSPVRTFVPFDFGQGDIQLVAAYTCTPLVTFPLSELKPKAHVMGRTIAELGNRNRPLDMVVYSKEGSDYLLMANSSRGVMKVETINFDNLPSIDSKVADTEGAPYDTVANWEGIEQLDLLDSSHALVLQKAESGMRSLVSLALP